MPHYKPIGQMLVVGPPAKLVEEVSVRKLSRDTSEVIARVREGRRIVVTRYGTPVAVMLEVDEAIGLCGTVVLRREEARRRLFGADLDSRLRDRRTGRLRRELESRPGRRS